MVKIKPIIKQVQLNKCNGQKYINIPKKYPVKEGDNIKLIKIEV